METRTRASKALKTVFCAALAALLAAGCALGALALGRLSSQSEQLEALSGKLAALSGGGEEAVTQEDDVAVGGEYYIRSTLPISDAYRSGDASALDERQAETLSMASAVLEEIIAEGMTDYEKEKAVYDWMCANLGHEGGVTTVVPTASEYSAAPYGVLKYGQAVCVGFATTFRMFMQMLGIDCMVVHNSYHSWDLVSLDGEWYHVDVYSDVGSGGYANFNMTDEMAAGGHEWDRSFFPAAEGLKYCYAYTSASPLEDVYALPALVREAVESQTAPKLYFIADGLGKREQQSLGELISRTGDAVMEYGYANGRDMWMDYSLNVLDDGLLISLNVVECSEDDGPDAGLDEADYARIDEAVNGAFGDVLGGYAPEDEWEEMEAPV